MLQPFQWSYFLPGAVVQSEAGRCFKITKRLNLASASHKASRGRLEIRSFLAESLNTGALSYSEWNAFPLLLATHKQTDTHWYQRSIVIYLMSVNVSMFDGPQSPCSDFLSSLLHTPQNNLLQSPPLSLFISPSSTLKHSFPFPASLTVPTYISLL